MFCFGIPGLVPPPTERIIAPIAAFFKNIQRRFAHFLRRAADADFERIHIPHQAHAVTHALLHLGDVRLFSPVQDVEPAIRQMIQTGLDFRLRRRSGGPAVRAGDAVVRGPARHRAGRRPAGPVGRGARTGRTAQAGRKARRVARAAAPGLVVLAPVYLLLGAMFVSIDLSTVAFAQHFGHKPLAGFILGTYALGSATGGLWMAPGSGGRRSRRGSR